MKWSTGTSQRGLSACFTFLLLHGGRVVMIFLNAFVHWVLLTQTHIWFPSLCWQGNWGTGIHRLRLFFHPKLRKTPGYFLHVLTTLQVVKLVKQRAHLFLRNTYIQRAPHSPPPKKLHLYSQAGKKHHGGSCFQRCPPNVGTSPWGHPALHCMSWSSSKCTSRTHWVQASSHCSQREDIPLAQQSRNAAGEPVSLSLTPLVPIPAPADLWLLHIGSNCYMVLALPYKPYVSLCIKLSPGWREGEVVALEPWTDPPAGQLLPAVGLDAGRLAPSLLPWMSHTWNRSTTFK